MSLNDIENIERIIYMWRRYEGTKNTEGKRYTFSDIDELNSRIEDYKKNKDKFDWDQGIVPDEVE